MTKFLTTLFISLCCVSSVIASSCILGLDDGAAAFDGGAESCLQCHKEYSGVLMSPMRARESEAKFITNVFSAADADFGRKNCLGCHINSCADCHLSGKPAVNDCLRCHNGINTGADYAGMGIREDNERYQRGPSFNGVSYMKMLPDVHFEKGITCGGCHTMKALAGGGGAKQCGECHSYSEKVIDHRVSGHDKVACVSCHAAWAPTEYGAFYIRFRESETRSYFRWLRQLSDEYVKSSFARHNVSPFLGKDGSGAYAPIRPRLVFFTDVINDVAAGSENRMLSNRWEKFTPHTVRRETPTCDACHNNRRKYLLEKDEDRIFLADKDGLEIDGFYNSRFFRIDNCSFVTETDYEKISERSSEYVKGYIEKLKQMARTARNAR